MKTAIELIQEERARQVAKGYTAEHDDQHVNGELAEGAGCYVGVASAQVRGASAKEFPVEVLHSCSESGLFWPFEDEAWSPEEFALQNLTKAAAMLVAEMERLQRTVTHPTWGKKI